MDIKELLANPIVAAILAFVLGIVGTIITTQILGRRSIFTYFVWHNRVGLSVNDRVFGNVQVTLNNTAIANLYHSTVELANNSFKDFEKVAVTIFTSNTRLLTQHTSIVDTPDIVYFTEAYAASIRVPEGQVATQDQFDIWNRRREYIVPTFNRGQKLRFSFLNAADDGTTPSIWLNVNHAGVRVHFHSAVQEIWGVPRPRAAVAGVLIGLILLTVLVTQVQQPWVIVSAAFVYGLFAQAPGAGLIRAWRWLRGWYGG